MIYYVDKMDHLKNYCHSTLSFYEVVSTCSTTGKPTHLFQTKCASLDSLSQLLPGANKVVNALRLRTKAFIAGLVQRRWTPWSNPNYGFDNYHNNINHTTLFLNWIITNH